MIVDETINSNVFVEQTTYYIYRCEEDRLNDKPFLTTSDKKTFELYKEKIRNGEHKLRDKAE
jgi:hypothetical protein